MTLELINDKIGIPFFRLQLFKEIFYDR